MSCRATPLNYAATTAARYGSGLDDAQVQSLFHALRRSADPTAPAPDGGEFAAGVRSLEALAGAAPGPAQARLSGALRDAAPPDGRTWQAVRGIGPAAATAAAEIDALLATVARSSGQDPGELRAGFDRWRADPDGFDDAPAPSEQFRYDRIDGMPTDERTARALRRLGREAWLDRPLPVFAYGTLQTGQHNATLLDGARDRVLPGIAPGLAVYGARRAFPYAAEHPDPGAYAVGEVAWLTAEGHRAAIERLDWLEGYDRDFPGASHYSREDREVWVPGPGGPVAVRAWVYLAGGTARARLSEHDRILSGDWAASR